jgi:hypothetical protein
VIERELNAGQAHKYELMLEAGQFVEITVEQLGINAKAILVKPDGKVIFESDSHRGARGIEPACAIAAADGRYELRVESMRKLAVEGMYLVTVTALRLATAQDHERIAAQVSMWHDQRWNRPYDWAAFVLQGEWR